MKSHSEFMDNLYQKLQLKSFDDWQTNLSPQIISNNGGKTILYSYYDGNISKLLQIIYPNFAWDFYIPQNKIFKQRQIMDKLFRNFRLKKLDDWLRIPIEMIEMKGGVDFFSFFNHDRCKLLRTIYPNFAWDFSKNDIPINRNYFKSIDKQREFVEFLLFKLKLNSLSELANYKEKLFVDNGGKLLIKLYDHNIPKLLLTLYPYFPWSFSLPKNLVISEDQLAKMNNIKNITKKKIQSKTKIQKQRWDLITNQQIFMDNLYQKLKLCSFEEWKLYLTQQTIANNGGSTILYYYYKGDINKLLQTNYPNYSWSFSSLQDINNLPSYLKSISNQRKLMNKLFRRFKLKKMEDWLRIPIEKIEKNGGMKLSLLYSRDRSRLLRSVFPDFLWNFSFYKSKETIIKEIIEKYNITQKKHWYRLSQRQNYKGAADLFKFLSELHPSEKWSKSLATSRSKKTTQRLLYSATQKIFSSHLIIEDYHHPMIRFLELDVFVPALQIALEYQGEHHFDDMPAFAGIGLYQSRDEVKSKLVKDYFIKLIHVPYWWDLSLSSLSTFLLQDNLIIN